MPTLAEGLHVVVKPCDLRRSLLFREIAILAVPRSPCLQNILLMTVQASSMPPRRPWPSRRRYCPGPRRAAIISGPTGGRRCPRYGALLKRGPAFAHRGLDPARLTVFPGQAPHESHRSKAISKARRFGHHLFLKALSGLSKQGAMFRNSYVAGHLCHEMATWPRGSVFIDGLQSP